MLDATLAVKEHPGLWIAGQLSGVEGYLESGASGLAAAWAADRSLRALAPAPFPVDTMLGALLHYITHAAPKDFCPTNAMLGLLPELPEGSLDVRALKRQGGTRALKLAKGMAHRARALASLEAFLQGLQPR